MMTLFGFSFLCYMAVLMTSIYMFPQAIYPLVLPKDHVNMKHDLIKSVPKTYGGFGGGGGMGMGFPNPEAAQQKPKVTYEDETYQTVWRYCYHQQKNDADEYEVYGDFNI